MTNDYRYQDSARAICMAIILVTLAVILAIMTSGCRSTTITRTADGYIEASHKTLFSNVETPQLDIEKEDDDTYKASYGAKSIDGDTESFGQFIRQMMLFFGAAAPPPADDS